MIARIFAGSGRLLRPTVIVLLIFSVVQVCWWMWDQSNYAREVMNATQSRFSDDLQAARRLMSLGVSTDELRNMFPHLETDAGADLTVAPAALAALEAARQRHVMQYVWESGFFLFVLAACIAVLWRGLHEEQEVQRQQNEFLALVSHQFKTPLASLQLSVETLVKRQPSPDYAQQLSQRMLDDLSRLEGMVTKILDSARLNRGQVTFHDTRVELAPAVDHVISRLRDAAEQFGVTLETQVPLDLAVHADPVAVENVLQNLVENAVNATMRDGGKVTVGARPGHNGIDVTVADTGVGFSAGDSAKLFMKFQRLEIDDPVSSTSTGLGLFIVDRIMHFQGGGVRAASPGAGKGATFTATWPRAAADRKDSGSATP